MNVIETKDLVKKYGNKVVVDHVCLHVKNGSIYGFVGENGSGKTTIMRLLMGLATQNSGDYALFGVDSKDKRIFKVRRDCSAIVEAPSLVMSMNAYDNLKYACYYCGVKDLSIIPGILDSVGLGNTGNKKVKNFSLGMRQRLGIAVLLLSNPKLLLLDEPMNGLDPSGIAELRELIISLNKKGITILISSHILSELEKVATEWGFICKGKLLQEISNEELLATCEKAIDIKYHDTNALLKSLKKIGLTKIKEIGAGVIKITDEITPKDLLNKLSKEGIEITDIKTVEISVEDYYLNLISKGGNR